MGGAWVMIDRGGCSFLTKIIHAQNAGALGVVMVNTLDQERMVMGGDGVTEAEVTIPSVLILGDDGKWLRERMSSSQITLRAMDGRSDSVLHTKLLIPPAAHQTIEALSQRGLFAMDRMLDKETKLVQVAGQGQGKETPNEIFGLLRRMLQFGGESEEPLA